MSSRPPARAARPPEENWQDSYFSLDERYRQLQKKFNEQEQALKLVKVARRKEDAPPAGPSLSSVSARRPSLRAAAHTASSPALTSSYNLDVDTERRGSKVRPFTGNFTEPLKTDTRQQPTYASPFASWQRHAAFDHITSDELNGDGSYEQSFNHGSGTPMPPQPSSSSFAAPPHGPPDNLAGTQEYISVPSVAGPQAARGAAISEASAWGDAATLPDPSMVWGTDGQSSMQNYVVASALYHANEELRRKLNESSTALQTFQQELANSRAQHSAVQTRLDNAAQQMHQLVRERDLASQKYTNASHTITDLERTLRDRVAEEEKVRFSMESQISELRSRLVVGADSNELLQKDVRSLLAETRDRTGEVMQLRSKLALAESALSAQRNVNENMLIELKSLNVQLVEERKRLITVTREAQVASLSGSRVADLQEQLRRVQTERNTVEQEHVALMSEFVHVTEDALRHAREEVRTDVADWKAAAEHWEQVSQLLYKDIAERTQQHLQCRGECEEAKEQRDTAGLQVRALKEEVALLSAKLEMVWPSHLADTKDLSVEEIQNVFGRKDRQGIFLFDERRRRQAASAAAAAHRQQRAAASKRADASDAVESETGGDDAAERVDERSYLENESFRMTAKVLDDFPDDPTTAVAQVQELHEVNAALLSEIHQLRLSNDLLQDRLSGLNGQQRSDQARVAAAEASLQRREKTGHALLEKQLDRVAFLEAQVKSLRGYHVPPNAPLDQIGDNENIFELFLGQLVAAEVPEGVDVPDLFSHVFCSVDFLLHETITTPTVRGLNGFFDVTASFCVSMDTLLFYYLHTRQLLVQLHRVRSEDETAAATMRHLKKSPPRESRANDDRGNSGGSAAVTTVVHTRSSGTRSSSSSSTHPSLRMAENMYETIAEGQLSLVDIVMSDACREASRPTMKGHVRLLTPDKRHIASLEFRLTARRPYSAGFLRVLQEAAATTNVAGDAPVDVAPSQDAADLGLLDWMRTTANTSAEVEGNFARGAPSIAAPDKRSALRTPSPLPHPRTPTPAHLHRSQMQLVPIASTEDATSSSSSFQVQQRSHMAESKGALVVHLPAPSPPPSRPSRNACSPWSARPPSSIFDGEEEYDERADSRLGSVAPRDSAMHDSVTRVHGAPSFMHVDRSLLTQPSPAGGRGGDNLAGTIACLWVDVERLELPADLPPPVPRLSCYFQVAALQKEVWLAAPPTARYTWPYAVTHREDAAGSFGTPLPIQSVTQLAAVVREPLVLFYLDADAMTTSTTTAATSSDPCVWAMSVCEWTQAVQHPGETAAFSLPLLRRDQSVVAGAVVRLSLTATTSSAATDVANVSVSAAQLPAPSTLFFGAPAGLGGGSGGAGAASNAFFSHLPPPPSPPPAASRSSAIPLPPPPPPVQTAAGSLTTSMEEELLRVEYNTRVPRNDA